MSGAELLAMSNRPGAVRHNPGAWRKLLEDTEVRRWRDTLALTNEGTADEYLRVLARYCGVVGATPAQLVAKAKDLDGGRRKVENQLQDFVVRMKKPHKPSTHGEDDADAVAASRCARGHMPGYLGRFSKALRSWMDHNDITLRRIRVGDTSSAPTVEGETPLTPDDVRRVLAASSPRGRVVVSVVAFACGRPEVLGRRRAEDGLTLGDLPDLDLGAPLRVLREPMHVIIRKVLSKNGRRYDTFLPAEARRYLVEYLEHRRARGERLTAMSPLVCPDYNRERQGRPEEIRGRPFLTTAAIRGEIREALRVCGLPHRPTALRSYFMGRMTSAERDGKIPPNDRQFFEGRNQAIDLRYTHFKALPQETIEELRRVYAACEPYLRARPAESGVPEIRVPVPGLEATAGQIQAVLEQLSRAIEAAKESRKDVQFAINVHPTGK